MGDGSDRILPLVASGNDAVLFAVALFARHRLQKRVSLLLLGAAGASVVLVFNWKAILAMIKQAVSRQISDILVSVVVQLSANSRNMNCVLQAVADGIRRSMVHDQFKSALKEVVVESMRFEQMNSEIVRTLSGCMVVASKDERLRRALLTVITEILKDESFKKDVLAATTDAAKSQDLRDFVLCVAKMAIKDITEDNVFMADVTSTITHSGLSVVRDEEVRDVMINIAKAAIVEALQDDAFLCTLRETAASSLSDGVIYRGAARGVVGALNPFGGRKKEELQVQQGKLVHLVRLDRPTALEEYEIGSCASLGDFDSCGYHTDEDGAVMICQSGAATDAFKARTAYMVSRESTGDIDELALQLSRRMVT